MSDPELARLGRLFTAAEAEEHLGINRSTVNTWHQRRDKTGLHPHGEFRYRGWPLFWEADLLAIQHGLPVRDDDGQRIPRHWEFGQ